MNCKMLDSKAVAALHKGGIMLQDVALILLLCFVIQTFSFVCVLNELQIAGSFSRRLSRRLI